MADWGEKFQSAWVTIRKKAGTCAANTDLEELKASIQLGQTRIGQALTGGRIAQGDSAVIQKLTKANEGLGAVGETLETLQNICIDITAVNKIHEAAVALSEDDIISKEPERAAAAFDSMFQGFGRLCRFLPPPAKSWQTFFEGFNLFTNVSRGLNPELRARDKAIFSQIDGFR